MSEPYEGGEAVWHFPGLDEDDPVCQSFADAAYSGIQQYNQQEPTRKNTVNARLTVKPVRPAVENDSYAAFARRVLRAYARRVATGDIEALTRMADLAEDIDNAIREAVTGLRAHGYSWAEIGRQLGVTRQAAQQRWGA